MSPLLKRFAPQQPLFNEGDRSTAIYIIQKGAVSIRKKKDNIFIEIARVHTGEVIGELSFFDLLPRSASGIALVDVEALEIPFEALEKIYSSVPAYLKTIVASMAERLRAANEQIRLLQHPK